MLSERDKDYIRAHYREMTVNALAKATHSGNGTVRRFMERENLQCLTRKEMYIAPDFRCEPPESCFKCPFRDCIKDVAQTKPSQKEVDFRALGFIDTIGRGNGRLRV